MKQRNCLNSNVNTKTNPTKQLPMSSSIPFLDLSFSMACSDPNLDLKLSNVEESDISAVVSEYSVDSSWKRCLTNSQYRK